MMTMRSQDKICLGRGELPPRTKVCCVIGQLMTKVSLKFIWQINWGEIRCKSEIL